MGNKCPSEGGVHRYDDHTGMCRWCGDLLEHKHELERNVDMSDAHREVFDCTNQFCKFKKEEYLDASG